MNFNMIITELFKHEFEPLKIGWVNICFVKGVTMLIFKFSLKNNEGKIQFPRVFQYYPKNLRK